MKIVKFFYLFPSLLFFSQVAQPRKVPTLKIMKEQEELVTGFM